MGDPNATQQGRRLLQTLDLAKKAGATNQEIADAILAAAAPQAAPLSSLHKPPKQLPSQKRLMSSLPRSEARRMDPTMSIDDYEAIENLDRQEREIVNRIQALTQPPEETAADSTDSSQSQHPPKLLQNNKFLSLLLCNNLRGNCCKTTN
jgi:hypothetical protein